MLGFIERRKEAIEEERKKALNALNNINHNHVAPMHDKNNSTQNNNHTNVQNSHNQNHVGNNHISLNLNHIMSAGANVNTYLNNQNEVKRKSYRYEEPEWEDVCKLCGGTGKLICCDSCPAVFHLKCLGLKGVPEGKWNCINCLKRFES